MYYIFNVTISYREICKLNIYDIIDFLQFNESVENYRNHEDVVTFIDIVNQFDINTLSETREFLYELFNKKREKIPY